MPQQPIGTHCTGHFLLVSWFISLLLNHHPNYFPFMPTESMSELNSLKEELFHVLIIDSKNALPYLHRFFHTGL